MASFPYHRIVVVGSTGSGKTTLAEMLAHHLGYPHIELDALYWKENWTPADREEMRLRVASASAAPTWVADGNYSFCRDILWGNADTVIWLDYSLWVVFWRLWNRTWQRWWRRQLLWGTNREPLLVHFKLWSDDSLFHWLFTTYRRRQRQYQELRDSEAYSKLTWIHLHTPRETTNWLHELEIP